MLKAAIEKPTTLCEVWLKNFLITSCNPGKYPHLYGFIVYTTQGPMLRLKYLSSKIMEGSPLILEDAG